MTDVLVTGGTGFIGRRQVAVLLEESCRVTVGARGRAPDPFGDRVSRIRFDRRSLSSMRQAFEDSRFDIVFDQIGFVQDDVADAVEAFSDMIDRYVFTSSSAVYEGEGEFTEADFDPMSIEPARGRFPPLSYDEGKRRAEAHSIPVGAVSCGCRPFTHRGWPRRRNRPAPVPRRADARGATHSRASPPDGGRSSRSATQADSSPGSGWPAAPALQRCVLLSYDAADLIELMARALDKRPVLLDHGPASALSPYATEEDFIVNTSKAESEGFRFTPFEEWFPRVTREAALALGPR